MLKNKPDIDKSFIEGEIKKERKRRESGIGKGLDFMQMTARAQSIVAEQTEDLQSNLLELQN